MGKLILEEERPIPNENKQKFSYTKHSDESEACAMVDSPIFEKLLTIEELADALGFAPQTIRNWVALRHIPFIRVGGKTRFRKRSVEAWLARKESHVSK
jgi:excisionase family DNA binding protein